MESVCSTDEICLGRGIPMLRSIAAIVSSVSLLGFTTVAAQAADPAVTCESGKLKTAGKYAACRLSADSKAVKTANTPDYTTCAAKFSDKWQDSESKGDGMCPGGSSDASAIQAYLDDCTQAVAGALSGGTAPYCGSGGGQPLATGQTISYGAGDDGDVQAGAMPSYVDNGDGTISDMTTGLMWEKKVALDGGLLSCTNESGGSCANPHDADNTYRWSDGLTGPAYDGPMVTIFLEQLNNRCDQDTTVSCTADADCAVPGGSCGFAGHRDWRLPNIRELQSIIDYSVVPVGAPTVQAAFNGTSCGAGCADIADPACSCTNAPGIYFYWSSTTYAPNAAFVWAVDFSDGDSVGNEGGNVKAASHLVRAVRSF